MLSGKVFFIFPVAKPLAFVLWVLKERNDTCSFRLEHSMTENQKRRITLMRQNHVGYCVRNITVDKRNTLLAERLNGKI